MVYSIFILSGGFIVSFMLTSWLIGWGIPKLDNDKQNQETPPESGSRKKLFDFKSTGFWIGYCETLLVFAFVYAEELGALAIIIGAKEFVRKENIQKDPSYYLLGTLINVSVALVLAVAAKTLIQS